MAKRGLAFYFVLFFGFSPLLYLYVDFRRNYKKQLPVDENDIQMPFSSKPQEKKRPPTLRETRLMGERMSTKEVPIADEESGYM